MAKLYLVSGPIGNLKDLTFRAKECLELADIVFCEDTRVCQRLLNYYNIKKPLKSCHEFNEQKRSMQAISLVEEGKNVVFLSDAGTPSLSDPGLLLIRSFIEKGLSFEVLPGPSAALLAWTYSGFGAPFTFMGFLPPKIAQIKQLLIQLTQGVYIFFVSPQNIERVLGVLEVINREKTKEIKVFLIKEMTKIFEKHFRGTPEEIKERVENAKGEFTLVIKIPKTPRVKVNKYPKTD